MPREATREAALPETPGAVRALAKRVRTQRDSTALWERIAGKGRRGVYAPRLRSAASRRARALLERRIVEFVETPRRVRSGRGFAVDMAQVAALSGLVTLRSAHLVDIARRWAACRDAKHREAGVHALAQSGCGEALPLLARVLRAGDARLQQAVAMAALSARSAPPRFRRTLFDLLVPSTNGERPPTARLATTVGDWIVSRALLALDAARARRLLRSASALHARNPVLWGVLTALLIDRDRAPRSWRAPDPDLLWALYDAARAGKIARSADRVDASWIADRIMLLAADRDPIRAAREARSILRMRGAGAQRKATAREALRRCARVPEPDVLLAAVDRDRGRVPPVVRSVAFAYEVAEHARQDGADNYFFNTGDRAPAALRGLRLVGALAATDAFQRAMRSIGPPAVFRDLEGLRDRLRGQTPARVRAFGRACDELECAADAVQAAVERYIGAHSARFADIR